MSTPSDLVRAQGTREVRAPQKRLGDRGRVDDVVGAREARLDVLDVHGSLVRCWLRHLDAAVQAPAAGGAVAAGIGSLKLTA
jgi:hypothetical protein